jgi:hypothetical protein
MRKAPHRGMSLEDRCLLTFVAATAPLLSRQSPAGVEGVLGFGGRKGGGGSPRRLPLICRFSPCGSRGLALPRGREPPPRQLRHMDGAAHALVSLSIALMLLVTSLLVPLLKIYLILLAFSLPVQRPPCQRHIPGRPSHPECLQRRYPARCRRPDHRLQGHRCTHRLCRATFVPLWALAGASPS